MVPDNLTSNLRSFINHRKSCQIKWRIAVVNETGTLKIHETMRAKASSWYYQCTPYLNRRLQWRGESTTYQWQCKETNDQNIHSNILNKKIHFIVSYRTRATVTLPRMYPTVQKHRALQGTPTSVTMSHHKSTTIHRNQCSDHSFEYT